MQAIATEGDGFIRSLARGLAVLRAFRPEHCRMTITEVASACDLTRAGARRMLLTLQSLGYVGMDGRYFYLTARVLDLSQGFLSQPLWKATRTALESVAGTLGETTSAGVLEGFNIIYTLRIRSSRMLNLELNPGDQLPAHVSSMGRVLLAASPPERVDAYLRQARFTKYTQFTVDSPAELRRRLEEARAKGWSWSRGEVDEAITGISVPLVGIERRTLAALHVSIGTERATPELVEQTIVPTLKNAAAAIVQSLRAG
jgi:IclR family pca regulon transcriptional regulator